MSLPNTHPVFTRMLDSYSPSVGASPVVSYMRAPVRGRVGKFACILGGTLTGDATVTVANVTSGVTIGTFVLTASGSVAGSIFQGTPTSIASMQVNEDDVISFTSASGTGASIPGHYSMSFRAA